MLCVRHGSLFITGTAGNWLESTDGGTSWESKESFTANDLLATDFISKDQGVAVGSKGTIIIYGDVNLETPILKPKTAKTHRAYPNPTHNFVYFKERVSGVKVFTTDGKLVLQEEVVANQLDLSTLEKGVLYSANGNRKGYDNREVDKKIKTTAFNFSPTPQT